MPKRLLIHTVAATVVVVFGLGVFFSGGSPSPSWLRFYSLAVSLAAGLLWAWEHLLWRLPIFQLVSGVVPDLRGTWKGQLVSLWNDPATGKTPVPRRAYLVVRQSATSLSLTLLTSESSSRSSLASVDVTSAPATVEYQFLNRPQLSVEARSRIHHGAAFLEVVGAPAKRLVGRYWTDRDSKGELIFDLRSSRICSDFREASELLGG